MDSEDLREVGSEVVTTLGRAEVDVLPNYRPRDCEIGGGCRSSPTDYHARSRYFKSAAGRPRADHRAKSAT
jgi:hypothetical protein